MPVSLAEKKVTAPASYFPSIEKKYGKPIGFWMSASQFEYWKHTHLTVDVVDGRGGGFSLESPEGKRFLIRSRLFTDGEWAILEKEELPTGAY